MIYLIRSVVVIECGKVSPICGDVGSTHIMKYKKKELARPWYLQGEKKGNNGSSVKRPVLYQKQEQWHGHKPDL